MKKNIDSLTIKLPKGQITQFFIVDETRKICNNKGINLTLREFADEMQVTIGRITNHFPTKDHLFAGLSVQYQKEYENLLTNFSWGDNYSLQKLHELTGLIMDLQFKHRCLMLYVCSNGLNQKVMTRQIAATWKVNLEGFSSLISALIQFGLMKLEVKQAEKLSVLRFQYINLFTTWLVSYTIYDNKKSYREMRAIYRKGIMNCLFPYLTTKGLKELKFIESH